MRLASFVSTTLGKLVESGIGFISTGPFGSQLHAHDYVDDGVPVVMPQQLGDNQINTDGIARITEADRDRLKRHIMREGDIVFSRRGDVTRRAYISAEQSGWLCGTGCLLVRLVHPDCDNRYLARFLGLHQTRNYLIQHAVGATMPNLNQGILASVPVTLPTRSEQKRIVDIACVYDDLIENNRRRIQLLEQAARLLYKEWFVHLRFPGHEHVKITNGVPDGWEKKMLGDLCKEIRESVSPDAFEPDTPYIGLEHIPRCSISLNEWGMAEQVTSSKHRFRENEILFGKIRPYFHKVGIAFVNGVASSDAIVIRPLSDFLKPLVLMTVSSDGFVAVTSQTMKEGSKMPRADWKQMQQYVVPLPPDGLLGMFNSVIEPIVQQLKVLSFHNRKLGTARDLLLPRLMNGTIPV